MDIGLRNIIEKTDNTVDYTHGCIEDMAQELMPGIGIRDISVGLKCVFSDRIPLMKYEYAYRSGNLLVLINGKTNKNGLDKEFSVEGRQEYDLRIVEELTVRRMEMLRCGIPINWDYRLIDCGEQKIKEVLTPKAYELLQKLQKYNMNCFGNGTSWNAGNESDMTELSITWNQYESPQDLSEVWNPQEGDGVEFLRENIASGKYPKHIIINNRIGYMFIPGLYYFGGWTKEFPAVWTSPFYFSLDIRKYAVAGYETCPAMMSHSDFYMMYLAIDDQSIEILKKIQKTLGAFSFLFEGRKERETTQGE